MLFLFLPQTSLTSEPPSPQSGCSTSHEPGNRPPNPPPCTATRATAQRLKTTVWVSLDEVQLKLLGGRSWTGGWSLITNQPDWFYCSKTVAHLLKELQCKHVQANIAILCPSAELFLSCSFSTALCPLSSSARPPSAKVQTFQILPSNIYKSTQEEANVYK